MNIKRLASAVALAFAIAAYALSATPESAGAQRSAASAETRFGRLLDDVYSYFGFGTELQRATANVSILAHDFGDLSYVWLARAEVELRRYQYNRDPRTLDEARYFAGKALDARPAIADAYAFMGKLELVDGCAPCARFWALKAEFADSGNADALYVQARIAYETGDRVAADRIAARALSAQRSVVRKAEMLATFATLHEHLAEIDKADQELREAVRLQPMNPWLRMRRAEHRIYQRGDVDAATREINESLRISQIRGAREVLDMVHYLVWARRYIEKADNRSELTKISAAGYLGEDDAFVKGARYPATGLIATAMLKAGAVTSIEVRDAVGNTALIASAIANNRGLMRELLAVGSDVNAANGYGQRTISFFVAAGEIEAVKLLLARGAATDFVDLRGRSPLLIAVLRRQPAMVRLLLENKGQSNPEWKKLSGELVVAAALNGDVESLKVLLAKGVAADAVSSSGQSALIAGVVGGNQEVVSLLLFHKADPNRKFFGLTALDLARQLGRMEIIKLLERYQRI